MKKKILAFILVLCMIMPCMVLFSACDTSVVEDVKIRVSEDRKYVQWSTDGENWENVIEVDEIKETLGDAYKGEQGEKGEKGDAGIDGKEVEFRKTSEYIQWKYTNESNSAWRNLIAISDLKGDAGQDGEDGNTPTISITDGYWYINGHNTGLSAQYGKWYFRSYDPSLNSGCNGGDMWLNTASGDIFRFISNVNSDPYWYKECNLHSLIDNWVEKVTISFDVNLPNYMYEFNEYIASNTSLQDKIIDKGEWCELTDFSDNNALGQYFLGWYVGDGVNETKVTSYTSICDDCMLKAKWDYDLIDETYTSAGVQWNAGLEGECSIYLTSNCGEYVHISKTYHNRMVTNVEKLAHATHTVELLLPGSVTVGIDGLYVSNPTPETWINTTLTKVSWYGDVTITKIGRYAFYGCRALQDFQLPTSVTWIDNSAFAYCTCLDYIDLSHVQTIGSYVFDGCVALNTQTMPDIQTIGQCAFRNCSNLNGNNVYGLFIGHQATTIGNNAFEGCVLLDIVMLDSSTIANLTDNGSDLFSNASIVFVKRPYEMDATAYLHDSQGHFYKADTSTFTEYDEFAKVVN